MARMAHDAVHKEGILRGNGTEFFSRQILNRGVWDQTLGGRIRGRKVANRIPSPGPPPPLPPSTIDAHLGIDGSANSVYPAAWIFRRRGQPDPPFSGDGGHDPGHIMIRHQTEVCCTKFFDILFPQIPGCDPESPTDAAALHGDRHAAAVGTGAPHPPPIGASHSPLTFHPPICYSGRPPAAARHSFRSIARILVFPPPCFLCCNTDTAMISSALKVFVG